MFNVIEVDGHILANAAIPKTDHPVEFESVFYKCIPIGGTAGI